MYNVWFHYFNPNLISNRLLLDISSDMEIGNAITFPYFSILFPLIHWIDLGMQENDP